MRTGRPRSQREWRSGRSEIPPIPQILILAKTRAADMIQYGRFALPRTFDEGEKPEA